MKNKKRNIIYSISNQLRKKSIFISLVFFYFILIACEKETSWNIDNTNNFIVVDALLTNELKTQEINISEFNGAMNGSPVALSGVEIELTNRTDTFFFTESTEYPGKYISIVPFRTSANQNYQLSITYQGIYDTAYAEMKAIDNMEALSIVQHDSLYRINYIESTLPSMMDIYYDWSSDSDYCEKKGYCQAWETFYTLRKIDIQKEFAPGKEVISFPRGTTIIRKKYSLSEDHADFLRSLLIETEWRGGLFDIEQGNVPSNFKYGARGWFGVCMVIADTTRFD